MDRLPGFARTAFLLFAAAAALFGQPQIVGPDQGLPGQVLTYSLQNRSQPLVPDEWAQGFNPDRYRGFDYATSFRLQLDAQADGAVKLTAHAPGRYRLLAYQGGQVLRKIVLIRPSTISPGIRSFGVRIAADNGTSSGLRTALQSKFALAKKTGANWVELARSWCIDLDSMISTLDPTVCSGTADTADLEWALDEAHRQGLNIVLEPAAVGQTTALSRRDLQLFLQGLSDAKILQVLTGYIQYTLQMAALAQKHQVEAMFLGTNWQLLFAPSPSLAAGVNEQWNSAISQVRSSYNGKIWMGWAFTCDTWPPFDSWSKVDGIHSGDRLKGSGVSCKWPTVPGLFNISAEDMLPNLRSGATLPVFQLQKTTGLPVIWGDFYPGPYDGTNFFVDDNTPWSQPAVVDYQEGVDKFEATMASGLIGKGDGFSVWSIDNAAASPAFAHAVTNWFGGDPTVFEPCLKDPSPGVLLSGDSSCPSFVDFGMNSLNLFSDFTLTESATIRSTDGRFSFVFRTAVAGVYAFYSLDVTTTDIRLTKYVTGQPYTILKLYTISGGTLGKQLNITLTAVRNSFKVTLGGLLIIDMQDIDSPLLSGTSSSGSTGIVDFSIVARPYVVTSPPPGVPVLTSVTNAASFLEQTISSGEIVTLFGNGMGPTALAGISLTSAGKISTAAGGTRVLFDGVAAPIIYAQSGQVSAIVPYGVQTGTTNVQVEYQGVPSAAVAVPVSATAPGIFTAGLTRAAAINQDGTINTPANPAARNSYLTIFLTGGGQLKPPGVDGGITTSPLPELTSTVTAFVGQVPATIQYAGPAPAATNGLIQINLQVPASAPTGSAVPIVVAIGNYVTQANATVAIQP